jgi:hypothetical protein
MSSTKYTYSVAQDFSNGLYIPNLVDEIQSSSIVTAFDYATQKGNKIDLWFKAALSGGDETTLDSLVASHDSTIVIEDTPVSVSTKVKTVPQKPDPAIYSRIYSFSVNVCDPTTWYVDSEYIEDELLASATGQTEFYTLHGSGHGCAIIDLHHGKITEENMIVAPTGSYYVSVSVSGIEKTERECYEKSGGDYEVDYLAGKIKFFEPQYGDVRASYFHTPSGLGPIFSVAPPAGKKWTIDAAELQVSKDFTMTDTIVQNVFLTHPLYGRIKGVADVEYKHFSTFLDFTYGSYPVIPVIGTGPRAMCHDSIIMRWEYLTPLELLSSLEMELRSWAKHGRKFDGERFVLTVYGLESDE